MLDPDTGKSPLVYALIQAMARTPSSAGGGGLAGLGGIPLSSLMQMLSRQPSTTPQGGIQYDGPTPTPGASAIG